MVKNGQKDYVDSVSELNKMSNFTREIAQNEGQKNIKIIERLTRLNNELENQRDDLESQKNDLKNQRDDLESQNEILNEELRLLRLKLYAGISERFLLDDKAIQMALFPSLFDNKAPVKPDDEKDFIEIKGYKRKKNNDKKLPEDLERIEIIHDIPESEKQCCGVNKTILGYETSEKLIIEPAVLKVEVHKRPKYVCRLCEGLESEGKTISIAPMPPVMIPKSISTPSLLAHIFVSKFCDALPFYRQEQQFKRYGVELTRATMSTWAIRIATVLEPLLELLRLYILSGPLINLDETTIQVLDEPGRNASSKSYFWVANGGPSKKPAILFRYDQSRGSAVAKDLLEDYDGFVQTDGYAGYNFLNDHLKMTHFVCWAHVRRKFNDVIKTTGSSDRGKGLAAEAMYIIRELYKIEKRAEKDNLEQEAIHFLRQKESKPIIEKFKEWLDENIGKVPPKSLLGRAFMYTLGQWPNLIKYINNGIVKMDNNLAENAIRPFVIGRKNWLFSKTPEGAKASALLYSLIETAKANKLDTFKYFKYLFMEFPYVLEKYKNTTEVTKELFWLLPMNLTQIEINQKLEKENS
jgi:transposase